MLVLAQQENYIKSLFLNKSISDNSNLYGI